MILARSDKSASGAPSSRKSPAAPKPVDPQAIEALRALNPGDDSFLRELIEIYFTDSPQRIAEIELSLINGDSARLVRPAHSLKGSSSNFGARRLSRLSEKIEEFARKASLDKAAAQLPALKEEYARVRTELAAYIQPK